LGQLAAFSFQSLNPDTEIGDFAGRGYLATKYCIFELCTEGTEPRAHLRLEHLDLAVQAAFSGLDFALKPALNSIDPARQLAPHRSYFAPYGHQLCPVLAQFGGQEILQDLPH
jgi:hypothetical protein